MHTLFTKFESCQRDLRSRFPFLPELTSFLTVKQELGEAVLGGVKMFNMNFENMGTLLGKCESYQRDQRYLFSYSKRGDEVVLSGVKMSQSGFLKACILF
ncbi:hypothetical protein AVEN_42742-1 [Araneus ventricosus]|uniref:Uncharacterized protein n=1 Tax=Araneus ventricosus TaxID=182803 RepID=A0A4Y2AEK9_ARAVE|nr:hypothetical protein AVEN_42742-1 [Araneus ventricosus]